MNAPEKDLGDLLEDLANKMAEDAALDGVKLSERLEVFKHLSQHYVSVQKVKGKGKGTLPPGGTTMASLKDRVSNNGEDEHDQSAGSSERHAGGGSDDDQDGE